LSELQLALIALAVLALLALFLSEKWQEQRRVRRLRERLHGGVGDALLQAGRAGAVDPPGEPMRLGDRDAAPAASMGGAGTAVGTEHPPAMAPRGGPDGGVTSEALVAPGLFLRPDWAEDPLLDCSLEIRCARAVDGVSVIEAAARLLHAPWKLPVHFVVWDGRHQQWVLPDRFGYYTDALASIQLADRRACVDEAEIERFVQAVQDLAQTLGADVDLPDAARLVAQAGELDRLCARFDVRIGLTVESGGGGWTGPQLRAAAQECGFVATGNQRWVQRMVAEVGTLERAHGAVDSDDGADRGPAIDLPQADDGRGPAHDLYTLKVDPDDPHRLVLEYDIARAPVASAAFGAMVEHARFLAATLGGSVVDDHGRPIDERSVATVERQLAEVFAQMRTAGIEPGSTRARRLYR